jgi:hypothetical protein
MVLKQLLRFFVSWGEALGEHFEYFAVVNVEPFVPAFVDLFEVHAQFEQERCCAANILVDS